MQAKAIRPMMLCWCSIEQDNHDREYNSYVCVFVGVERERERLPSGADRLVRDYYLNEDDGG